MLYGIDVSTHNGLINWGLVKQSGVDFAMVRGGYSTTVDNRADYNLKECNAAEIGTGMYWFSYALNVADVKREANAAVNLAKKYQLDYPIAFDFEEDSEAYYLAQLGYPITNSVYNLFVKTFCEEVIRLNFWPMNYCNLSFYNRLNAENKARDIWLAKWGSPPAFTVPMWQYYNKGVVPGISGDVDQNYCYVDYPQFIRSNGFNLLSPKMKLTYYLKRRY